MRNNMNIFGLFFETALVAFLSYVEPLCVGLGTRHVASPHFAIPAFSFFVFEIFCDETRKNLVRSGTIIEKDKKTGLETRTYVGWFA
jgi:hypothetical protein